MKSYREILDEMNNALSDLEWERAAPVSFGTLITAARAYSEAVARHTEALTLLMNGRAKVRCDAEGCVNATLTPLADGWAQERNGKWGFWCNEHKHSKEV